MKAFIIFSALVTLSIAMNVEAPHAGTHTPLEQMPMPMPMPDMMMYMNFWAGYKMSFDFVKLSSSTKQ